MKKEDLQNLKKVLEIYYKEKPRKLETSILTVGFFNISTIASIFNNLLENKEEEVSVEILVIYGITTIALVVMRSYQKSQKPLVKKKILK